MRRLLPARLRERLKDQFLTLPHALRRELTGHRSVLDVGCGADSPLQCLVGVVPVVVGVDGHRPSLLTSRGRRLHGAWIQLDLERLGDCFPPASFDAVVALDMVEHLEKPADLRLLEALERIARRKVLVFTPNGFVAQDPVDGNPFQVHRSGWSAQELRQRGYRVQGLQGQWFLRGAHARQRLGALGAWACWVSQPLLTSRPEVSFSLLGVLDRGA